MILFVHPYNRMLLSEIFPMSLPAIINRLPRPVLGRFYNEWSIDEVKKARIIIMDIHWYLMMKSAIQLSRMIRGINPDAVLMAGGLSATLFSKQLLRDSSFDFIIRGDAELPLSLLVKAILVDKDPSRVPNVVSHDFESEQIYTVTTEDLDEGIYRDISFFPSMELRLTRIHAKYMGYTHPTYPYLVSFRGCPLTCESCYGSLVQQKKVFKRGHVVRSPEKVREDLVCWSDDSRWNYVNLNHDFLSILPVSYAEKVFNREYNLFPYVDGFRQPSDKALDLFLEAFRGGIFAFSIDWMHTTSESLVPIDHLISQILKVQRRNGFRAYLQYARLFARKNVRYRESLQKVQKATGCQLYEVDLWWDYNPRADELGYGDEEDYRTCLARSSKYFLYNMAYRTAMELIPHFPRLVGLGSRFFRRFSFLQQH